MDSLGLDSLLAVEVVSHLEDQIGTRLPERDLAHVNLVGDLVALVRTHQAGREAARAHAHPTESSHDIV